MIRSIAGSIARPLAVAITGASGGVAPAPVDTYAANSFSPDYVADFSATDADYFRVAGATSDFSTAFTSDSEGGGLATQVDSSGNLVWRAHNLLTYSSDIDNGSGWSGSGATASGNTVTSTSGTGGHSWQRASGEITNGLKTTCSAQITPGTHDFVYLLVNVSSNNYALAVFDLSGAGVVSQTASAAPTVLESSSVESLGDGSFVCSIEVTVSGTGTLFTGFAEQASGNTLLSGGRVDWQSAAAGTETYELQAAWAYRSDLGGMVDVLADQRAVSSLTKYVPTTTAARYLARRRHHRWDGSAYVPTCLHEPVGATNELPYSIDLSNGNWQKSNASVAKTATGIDGVANSAYVVTDASSGSFGYVQEGVTCPDDSNPAVVTFRVPQDPSPSVYPYIYLQFTGGTNVIGRIVFDPSDGSYVVQGGDSPTAVYVEDEDDRWAVSMVVTNNGTGNTNCNFLFAPAGNTDGSGTLNAAAQGSTALLHAQLVLNASLPSSPIITNGSTVTRTADTLKGKAASLPYSSTAISMAVAGRYSRIRNTSQWLLSWFQDASNRALLYLPSTNDCDVFVETSGSVEVASSGSNFNVTGPATAVNAAARFVGSGELQIAESWTAGSAETTTTPAIPPLSDDDLLVSADGAGSSKLNGTVDTIRLWDEDIAEAGIEEASAFGIATGGTVTDSGGYRYHTFTGDGTLTVTKGGTVEYLVAAGGGGGGYGYGGGGGGGGVLSASTAISAGSYAVTVGAGGAGATDFGSGNDGSDSALAGIATAAGGGGGGGELAGQLDGRPGGSGGGAGGTSSPSIGGVGTASQGNDGGDSANNPGGGGGGAGAVGADGAPTGGTTTGGGDGGDGVEWPPGSGDYYGGGGGGAFDGSGGLGGGGDSAAFSTPHTPGAANTGGGGGGFSNPAGNGDGGSGIVIVRYPI